MLGNDRRRRGGDLLHLDDDTRDALGYGDHWTQLALRFGPWLVKPSTRRDWRKGRSGAKAVAPDVSLSTTQRREVSRRDRLGHPSAVIARALGVPLSLVRRYLRAKAAA